MLQTPLNLDATERHSRAQVGIGLSFKQAVATLLIALALGLLSSAYELWSDYRLLHAQVRDTAVARLQLVRGLAVEAAYQLSSELASEVARGLLQDEAVATVRLSDNYGGVLGQVSRPPAATPFPGLAARLFDDVTRHATGLQSRAPDGALDPVGQLDMTLDAGRVMNRYLERVKANVLTGALRVVLMCVAVVAVFYGLITKPLLRITAAIGKVDPGRPGAFLIPMPSRHSNDELGLLVDTVNAMLTGSQAGLDGRDKAEADLAALARDLEQRVLDRTHELAREKEEVERALAQLNLANAELEKANRFVNDGIRYASRIQTALLPDPGALAGVVDDVAVGWQPLDLVGGDYYWAGVYGGKAVVAVMDCTGHGVPGAFMTAVVASGLSRVLQHHGHDDPAQILAQLNRLVRTALRQDRDSAVSNDGLDAAVCILDRQRRTLTFAGANIPLLVCDEGRMRCLRGDRQSLGYRDSAEDARFATHEVGFGPGTTFYLFTDGVTDQVGGPSRRLFGRRRVEEALLAGCGRPLDQQMEGLFARLAQWRGAEPRRDDMTFVAFRPMA